MRYRLVRNSLLSVSEGGRLCWSVFLGQVMSFGGLMCVTSNRLYAVIETSCLSYIFSILPLSFFYILSPSVKFQRPTDPSAY